MNDEHYARVNQPLLKQQPSELEQEWWNYSDSDHGWSDSDNVSVDVSSANNSNNFLFVEDESSWRFPTPQEIWQVMDDEKQANDVKKAYQILLTHKESHDEASDEWYPFVNLLCFLLFIGRFDPYLCLTDRCINFILILLHTLQAFGIIIRDYYIPKDASVVRKWFKNIPQPPLS